jgi:hypothetical protein
LIIENTIKDIIKRTTTLCITRLITKSKIRNSFHGLAHSKDGAGQLLLLFFAHIV